MLSTQKTCRNLNILLIVAAMLCLVYYYGHRTIFLKGLTSAWFVLLGFVNLCFAWKRGANRGFLVLLEIGLFLSAAADVILWNHFMLGALVFALGHLFYFAAFCALEKFRGKDWAIIPVTAAVSLLVSLGNPYIRAEGEMRYLLAGYALVISFMLGKDIGNFLAKRDRARLLMLIGGGLFWFSDLMLAFSLFGSGGSATNFLCMFTYWPGQSILAHALFYLDEE